MGEAPAARWRPDFCWFNTHFDAFNKRARTESAKLLHDRMVQIAGFTPWVGTGDFNTGPASVPYPTLLAEPSRRRLRCTTFSASPILSLRAME